MIRVEKAWTRALLAVEAVERADARAALAAMARYAPNIGELARGSDADGVPVPALIRELRAGLTPGEAAAIHTGLTSQDVIDTAMVLTLLTVLTLLEERLDALVEALDGLVRASAGRRMTGRTRMQAALPIPAAARIESWRGPLTAHLARLDPLRARLARAQIGGPVGLRDAPAEQGERAAAEAAHILGLGHGPVWHSDRAPMVEAGHWLVLVSGSLGKLGQDVALMAQQGVDDIALSGGGGSSAMAHKRNPVRAETLVTLARFVSAQHGALTQAMVHEQERSGTAWALEWMTLPAMAEATGAALRHALALIAQVESVGRTGN